MIEQFRDYSPKIHKNAFVHEQATIIGDVIIEEGASIWPSVVLRGDMGSIKIGKNTSIQDGTIGHMTEGYSQTIVGNNVTVGHNVILHGCIIEDDCLIGMGSIILDNAHIGKGSFVAAGSMITPEKIIEPDSSLRGSPAKVIRKVNDFERTIMKGSIEHYQNILADYKKK